MDAPTIYWAPKGDSGVEVAVVGVRAFHRCDPDPAKSYGISGGHMYFALRKDGNAILFDLFPDWGQTHEAFHAESPDCNHPMHRAGYPRRSDAGPHAGAVQLHLSTELPTAFGGGGGYCDWTGRNECWTDIGFSIGEDAFTALRNEGTDGLWKWLEDFLDNYIAENRSTT